MIITAEHIVTLVRLVTVAKTAKENTAVIRDSALKSDKVEKSVTDNLTSQVKEAERAEKDGVAMLEVMNRNHSMNTKAGRKKQKNRRK